ncbi:MAG: hypothetical protein HY897_21815 [Deltaproteobacteria bacterium]|nr:hypothetical protein [Deltaproteobacteria bacterium]
MSYDENSGVVYIADTGNHSIRVVTKDARITKVAGGGLAEAGMARESLATSAASATVARYATYGSGVSFTAWKLLWVRDADTLAALANGIVVDSDTRDEIGKEIEFTVVPGYDPALTITPSCHKMVCGHSSETMQASGACQLKSVSPSFCKTRADNYYSSSTNYNLRQDLPEVPTFRYTRKSPGTDKWRIQWLYDAATNTWLFKDIYTTAYLGPSQALEVKGIDLGTTPFRIKPGRQRGMDVYGLPDVPDDPRCGSFEQENCEHILHGSRRHPIDHVGQIFTSQSQPGPSDITFKFLDVEGTYATRAYLFGGTANFEGFVKRAVDTGFNTISLQIRVGIARVLADDQHTDLVYFLDPCETPTPEAIEQYVFVAKAGGIANFDLEFITASIYQIPKKAEDFHNLADQYIWDWFLYGRNIPSNAEKVHCFGNRPNAQPVGRWK